MYGAKLGDYLSSESFFEVDFNGEFDAENYEALGLRIVQALTAAGFDLTYNRNGVKIYSDNEEAARAVCPWLFSPVLVQRVFIQLDQAGGSQSCYPPLYSKIVDDGLYCFLQQRQGAFVIPNRLSYELYDYGVAGFYYIRKTGGGTLTIHVDKSSTADPDGTITQTAINVSDDGAIQSQLTVKTYELSNSGSIIKFPLDGPTPFQCSRGDGFDQGSYTVGFKRKAITMQMYNQNAEFDFLPLIQGTLEINARFAKSNRKAKGLVFMRLDNSTPTMVVPGNYSEAWWDEYDVEPIGTVLVTYHNEAGEEIAATIVVGNGGSTYDMSANEAINRIANGNYSAIKSLIRAEFLPHIADVAFTPAELTMQGWPWLEAGDALEIEAEDGTLVDTYALRVEMSGIQNLQSVITATGGEIIQEV